MTDKMREEFETAVALEAKEPVLAVYLSRRDDTYSTSTLHFAWWAWKASRAALLKKQVKEQEEFLDHLADFEPEDTLHE
ncbi:hypothetical protein JFT44_22270 [Pseudomonas sp. MF5691]|uniref:hypothetical protein n=1 Tax=Pseudomonas sp. MF5691 TaxID=2797526 RepID=UPI0018E82C1B|nr:hypothetical protein [Pseudomonas sp. MF5691]MBJ2292647.1 hypothetical protein [Pseudomonas sp. MF5691]